MRTDLVTDALAAAERTRGSLAGAVMHTNHGAQYTSRAFADACRQAGVRQSMSAIGSSADNALAESFNATFKRETLQDRKRWSSEREARLDAFRRLNRYNTRRRHSHLGQRKSHRLRGSTRHNINYPGPSRIARVQDSWSRKRVRFDHVTERVSARLPEREEAELLELPEGVPVLSVLVVACDASGQALQVSDVLLPADRQELEDTYRLN